MDYTPTDGLPPGFREAYEALRESFRSGLAERWREIEHARNHTALIAALHRLAGAAGSYGFPAISTAARAAQNQAEAGAGPALASALDDLRRAMPGAEGP